ncbi:HK97 gp10 family phage protein [Anaerosporobacter sp.]
MSSEFECDPSALIEAFNNVVDSYTDIALDEMERTAKEFRKDLVKNTKQVVDTSKQSKLIKGYKFDKTTGFGSDMEKNLRCKAPHFHLVEKGHNLITPYTKNRKMVSNGGQRIGFVPGKFMLKKTCEEYEEKIPEAMQRVLDTIRRENNI